MAAEVLDRALLVAGFRVPDFDGVVGSGSGNHLAVAFPGDSEHMAGVTFDAFVKS